MLKQHKKNEKLTHIDKEHRDHCLNLLRPHIYKLKNILELSHSNPWVLGIGKCQNKWYLSFCSLELASKYSTNSEWQRFFFSSSSSFFNVIFLKKWCWDFHSGLNAHLLVFPHLEELPRWCYWSRIHLPMQETQETWI